MSIAVWLTYFKPESGKYYTEGGYESNHNQLSAIWSEVRELAATGALPGLKGGASGFIILVKTDHENDHPKLILPEPADMDAMRFSKIIRDFLLCSFKDIKGYDALTVKEKEICTEAEFNELNRMMNEAES